MPNCIVSLFFSEVFLLMCIACNSRTPVAGHENSVQIMFAATGERPELQGRALQARSSRGARQLMVNHL